MMRCERPSSAMEPMASSKPCCGKKRNCQRQYISSRRRRSLAWAGQRRASGCRCQPSARLGTYAGLWPQGSRKPPARPHARAAACSGLPGSSSSPSKPRASLTLLRNAAHGPGTAPAAGRREGFRDQVRAPAPAAVHPLRAAGWGCSVRQRQTRLCGRRAPRAPSRGSAAGSGRGSRGRAAGGRRAPAHARTPNSAASGDRLPTGHALGSAAAQAAGGRRERAHLDVFINKPKPLRRTLMSSTVILRLRAFFAPGRSATPGAGAAALRSHARP